MTYWSRSRGSLWRKGETSGHTQRVIEAWIDCDGDNAVVQGRTGRDPPATQARPTLAFFRKAARRDQRTSTTEPSASVTDWTW